MKNVITRSVGFERDLSVETYEIVTHPRDVFLICSDGLSGLIKDGEMQKIVERNLTAATADGGGDIHSAVKELIGCANKNGGDDNITSVMIEVLP
jgi:protein phosphatase